MKLLSWMHHKFRQNSNEPVRNSGTGKSSLDNQQHYQQQPKPIRKAHREYSIQYPFASLDPAPVGEEDLEEDSSATISDLFQGYLAIGTLGSDLFIKDLSEFSLTIENIKENKTDVTQNDMNLIIDELERVLGDEIMADGGNYTSRRNDHVSTGRNSQVNTRRSSPGSSIPLSVNALEGNVNGSAICPLQGHNLGTGMEISEKTTMEKEYRTSLEELLQKARVEEESSKAKYERGEKHTDKEGDKSVLYRMKKILRKKMNRTSKGFGGTVDSASTKTTLHNILHMFHNRKVHPEKSGASRKYTNNPRKNELKNSTSHDVTGHQIRTDQDEDIILIPQSSTSKRTISRSEIQSTQTQFTSFGGDSYESKEHWIKSDIEYLVLEL